MTEEWAAVGFMCGSVVRHIFSPRRNMLVVRDMGATVACIVIEGDGGGTVRLREFPAVELISILDEKAADQIADLEFTFDLRWKADMRAIERWQSENPEKRALTLPDHTDLCVWLLEKLDAALQSDAAE
jgi:hypothetical protein